MEDLEILYTNVDSLLFFLSLGLKVSELTEFEKAVLDNEFGNGWQQRFRFE